MDLFEYDRQIDVEELLERSHREQRRRLFQELEGIDDQLDQRERLHEELVDELESKRDWYVERLELLYKRGTGTTGKREELKERIESFYQQLREEKRNHWQDRQELQRKRREILSELAEINTSRNLLEDYLGY